MGIVAFVAIFVALYLILLIPSVQSSIKTTAEKELSVLLDTDINIDRISIAPFSQVVLYGVEVPDKNGLPILKVDKLGAGVSLYNLAVRQRLVFTYAELIGLEGRVYKDTPDSDLNIQFIIDALSPKDKNKPPTKFDLTIYNIVLRKSALSYDVLSEELNTGKFDKNHIKLNDLRADIELPLLKNDDFFVKIKRLSFREQCGFNLKNLTVNSRISDREIAVSDFRVELPNSRLALNDFSFTFDSLKSLGKEINEVDFDINVIDSYVTLKDLSAFVPAFSKFSEPVDVSLTANGSMMYLQIPELKLTTDNERITVTVNGVVEHLDCMDSLSVEIPHIYMKANTEDVAVITSNFTKLSNQAKTILANTRTVIVDGSLSGTMSKSLYRGEIKTSQGELLLDGYIVNNNSQMGFNGAVSTNNFNVGELLGKEDLLGETAFDLVVDGGKNGRKVNALVKGNVSYLDFKGYRYNNISANLDVKPSEYSGTLEIADENLLLRVDGSALLQGKDSHMDVNMAVCRLNLANVNLDKKNPDYDLSFKAKASAQGDQIENLNGKLLVENLNFVNAEDAGIKLNRFEVVADNTSMPYTIDITSDVLNGKLEGYYKFDTLLPALKDILSKAFPVLFEKNRNETATNGIVNDFRYIFSVESNDATNSILNFFKSPVTLLYPVTLSGHVSEPDNTFNAEINAPYLAQKNKLIEDSRISLGVDSLSGGVKINAHTVMPTKNGKMSLNLNGDGIKNRLNTDLSWKIDREADFHGNVDLSVALGKVNETNSLMATIDVNPTTLVFNDTTWYVHNSRIGVYNKTIRVDDFKVTCDNQFVSIDGKTSAEPDDKLVVELKDINLDYIFETLQINNVTFGGCATGKIVASELLSKSPKLETERFNVDGMMYNETLLGDADIKSFWDNEKQFVAIKALISQENGCKSTVDGEIYPMRDSMRFDFEAEKLKVGFMKPFMEAFTSDLDGYASGNARLYGKFSTLNMFGDIFVEDLKVKLDYTNVYYWATDSVKIDPGLISFKDVRLRDRYGNTAKMSGYVGHDDFHNARFKFDVTDAKNLLCYDIPVKQIDNWYGTIFGSGSAFVNGEPGLIGIDVHMTTAANSRFYFELSDAEDAIEYDFITFTDKRREMIETEMLARQSAHEQILRNFEQKKQEEASKTRMLINIDADINPLGQLILVMDPVGGDKIKATGSGSLIMKYDSSEDLFMRGKYTLDKGTYNFTLQDIIVKDFLIKEGSSIAFDGNPYDAKIDISAVYSLNANLLDLDESFASDKEFNRTNVPVHALLNVAGSIAQPEISFDLEFPTLTSDAYRKVKSVVSTDDMMNRQIIYLLALNRFYTPEYMGGTTRNNELASVASSTISSQLSSMLGQISDKWSISPNFKSDKGDFSDVEVNLALSSQLLNNRLLFNGNFGYRDKMVTTNNSNFIGDFDIEYLLNKTGNIRLKAYNHFNDQNYYVRNALTTQGVGVVFKYDFDRWFNFSKKKKQQLELNTDSLNDSVGLSNIKPVKVDR